MKITIDIKEKQYQTFLNFIKTLDYVSINVENPVPDWQQKETEKRKQMINSGEMKTHNWETVEKELFYK